MEDEEEIEFVMPPKTLKKQTKLEGIEVNPLDIELIMEEFEITRSEAEIELKKHGGDLRTTLKYLTQ